MRRRLIIFGAIAAVLTLIALIPGILVIAAFLGGVPAIILILAPYVLLGCVAFLIADQVLPKAKSAQKVAIAGLVMGGVLLALTAVAAWSNRAIEQDVQALTREDHGAHETVAATRDIAIQYVTNGRARSKLELAREAVGTTPGVIPPPARKQFCDRLCLHLLFNGLADSVLVSSVPAREGDPSSPNLAEIGVRRHLERAACHNPAIKTDDTNAPPFRLYPWGTEQEFAEEISARMIAGQCVVGEPARLSEAQIIVQESPQVLPPGSISNYPLAKNVLHLNLPPKTAARLSIYRVREGNAEEVFRHPGGGLSLAAGPAFGSRRHGGRGHRYFRGISSAASPLF